MSFSETKYWFVIWDIAYKAGLAQLGTPEVKRWLLAVIGRVDTIDGESQTTGIEPSHSILF